MKQRNYFKMNEEEKVIGGSDVRSIVFDRGGFLLTNQRVIKVDRTSFGGASNVHTINLENIDSIQTNAIKPNALIFFAFMSLLFLFIEEAGPYLAIGGFSICMLLFFLLRRKVIQIASGSSTMILNVSSMNHENIQKLVFEVEQAKQRRLEGIQHKDSTRKVSADVKQRLKDIQDLLNEGLINKEEYQIKRKQIMDQL